MYHLNDGKYGGTYLYGVREPMHFAEAFHRWGIGILRLGLFLLSIVSKERRITSESDSNFASCV